MFTFRYVGSVLAITVLALVVGLIFWQSEEAQTLDGAPSGGWVRGADEALVTIDAYPDFTCHLCVEKQQFIVEALEYYPDTVKLVYHPYPETDLAYMIAEALEAVADEGEFWELHDLMIQDVPEDRAGLLSLAQSLGIDVERLEMAIEDHTYREKIDDAKWQAQMDGVMSVAVFVNNREYQKYPGTLEDLYRAIEDALEEAGEGGSAS